MLVNTSNGEVDEQNFVIRGTYATKSSYLDETNGIHAARQSAGYYSDRGTCQCSLYHAV